MRHRKSKITLDRNAKQRRTLLRNLAVSLIKHERITTTPARARATKALVERLVTIGKPGTLHSRRQIISQLNSATATDKIVKTIAPRYKHRPGGYLRTVKLGRRLGDGADQLLIEFIPTTV